MFNKVKFWKTLRVAPKVRTGHSRNSQSSKAPCRFTMAKWRLASNPGTAPEVLRQLASRGQPDVLERVAENHTTDVITLKQLAQNRWPQVRRAVAGNEKLPVEIISSLGADDSADVRYVVAENYHVPIRILEQLIKDENPFVAARARQTLTTLHAS
jgi:hypothetical protein